MRGWPSAQETLVSSLSAAEVVRRLRATTNAGTRRDAASPARSTFVFNGQVDSESFRLSQKITRPNNFLPLISGTIEPTSQGCLLFVRYQLFTMTAAFLVFWWVVTLGFAYFLVHYERLYHYAALSVGVGAINYVVALLNFNKQVVISRRLLREVVNQDGR
ncbi:MAG: hypothetical protein WA958_19490 [Tunicatimonas sp.]